ncbi:LysR family transcriptional regulator [Pseudactinotalea sp. Z1748]|uniref:LysR family transcriptional regulator n=1 Tax=Pseudactinotalea sp. Z1748 TaxID=3413027 RepID=UPI003C7A022F
MYTFDQVRCFVVVAEELHFGRAAERLHMTQPPLSRQIQKLERHIGLQLLDRNSRGVALTPAGEAFLAECYRILDSVRLAPRKAQLIAEGLVGLLRIGYTATAGFSILGDLLAQLRATVPEVEVQLSEQVTSTQIAALESGTIDLSLGRPPFPEETLESVSILRDRLVLAMPEGSADGDGPIPLETLAGHPFIMFSPTDARYFHDLVRHRYGITEEQTRFQVTQVVTMVALVARGHGIAIVPASTQRLGTSGVAFRELAGEPTTVDLHAAWPRRSTNPALPHALRAIRELDLVS